MKGIHQWLTSDQWIPLTKVPVMLTAFPWHDVTMITPQVTFALGNPSTVTNGHFLTSCCRPRVLLGCTCTIIPNRCKVVRQYWAQFFHVWFTDTTDTVGNNRLSGSGKQTTLLNHCVPCGAENPIQYTPSIVYWCIASKLKAPRNLYCINNMFFGMDIFLFFVCYHVVPKRHSQLDYELNDL